MYCKYCGAENTDGTQFCGKCGQPIPAQALPQQSTSRKKKVSPIIIISAIATVVLLTVVIIIVSSGGSNGNGSNLFIDNSPYGQIIQAIENGDNNGALRLFDEARTSLSDEQKNDIEERVLKGAEQTAEAYRNRELDYDVAIDQLNEYYKWDFSSLKKQIQQIKTDITELSTSRNAFDQAEELYNQGAYIEAIAQYQRVSQSDPDYAQAVKRIEEAKNNYRQDILGEAAEYANNHDYASAIAAIQMGLSDLPNDAQLTSQAEAYSDAFIQYHLSNASEKWESGDFEGAITALQHAQSERQNEQIQTALDDYVQQYVTSVVRQADLYGSNEDYFHAIEILHNALAVLPDNAKLNDTLQKYDWTTVLYRDENYLIVRKDFETYSSYNICVGILDSDGNWVLPLSDNFIFAQAIQKEEGRTTYNGSTTVIDSNNVYYLGEDVFILSLGVMVRYADGNTHDVGKYSSLGSQGLTCYLYNLKTGTQKTFDAVWITPLYKGNALMYNSDRYNSPFYRVSSEGDVTELPVGHGVNDYGLSGYSEGMFFANGYFYDIYGKILIDLTSYNLTNTPYFTDGKCEIKFKNAGGTEYRAVIDQNGDFISDPEPT